MEFRRLMVAVFLLGGWIPPAAGQSPERFSLSLLHFNIQYVPGGLQGFPSGEGTDPTWDLTDAQVQDRIVRESLEPVLDLLLAHPGWEMDVEMQAYLVAILSDRHPDVLAKLKTLVTDGQLELVSFHHADQFFLAYPRADLERSLDRVDAVLEAAGLEASPVVFSQEGQFARGMIPIALARGRRILVLSGNLFRYQHLASAEGALPLMERDGATVVLGGVGFADTRLEVAWSFFDDGERLATGGLDPYSGTNFRADPAALSAFEQELEAAAAEGRRIASISTFVERARALGVEPAPLPPMLDGTWQPLDTDSVRRWMGAGGLLDALYACERDNAVLTTNVRTRHWIRVAETVVGWAEAQGIVAPGGSDAKLGACWEEMALAEVSDATGINPFVNEVRYAADHADAALRCADELITRLAPKIGGPVLEVDTRENRVAIQDDLPTSLLSPSEPGLTAADGFSVEAPGREIAITWEALPGEAIHRIQIDVSAPAEPDQRTLEATFPLDLEGFYSSPALVEDEVEFLPFADFDLERGRIALPLPNGLVGIGSDLWLVKHTSAVHVAASFQPGDGQVRFRDDTLDPEGGARWVFWLIEGSEDEALVFADRLNVDPTAHLRTGSGADRGCGCAGIGTSAPTVHAWVCALLAGLILTRRRGRLAPRLLSQGQVETVPSN